MSIDNFFTTSTVFGDNVSVSYSKPEKKKKGYDIPLKYDAYKQDKNDLSAAFRNAFRIVPLNDALVRAPYERLVSHFKLSGYNFSQPYSTNVLMKDIDMDTYNMTENKRTMVFIKGMTREPTETVYDKNPNLIEFSKYNNRGKYSGKNSPYSKRPDGKDSLVIKLDYNTPQLPGGIHLKNVA